MDEVAFGRLIQLFVHNFQSGLRLRDVFFIDGGKEFFDGFFQIGLDIKIVQMSFVICT